MRPALAIALALVAAIVASGIGLVYVQHARRASFVELQSLEARRDALETEWGQLQLERSAWAGQDRIERIARDELSLGVPRAESIVLVVP